MIWTESSGKAMPGASSWRMHRLRWETGPPMPVRMPCTSALPIATSPRKPSPATPRACSGPSALIMRPSVPSGPVQVMSTTDRPKMLASGMASVATRSRPGRRAGTGSAPRTPPRRSTPKRCTRMRRHRSMSVPGARASAALARSSRGVRDKATAMHEPPTAKGRISAWPTRRATATRPAHRCCRKMAMPPSTRSRGARSTPVSSISSREACATPAPMAA
mmetsp:Transcript_2201/g.6192  ORF Transcript_2201/g.6192 Transcript_2201/m.6192 type:complete len:220 (+) Transcript_2201:854-1513(+)